MYSRNVYGADEWMMVMDGYMGWIEEGYLFMLISSGVGSFGLVCSIHVSNDKKGFHIGWFEIR